MHHKSMQQVADEVISQVEILGDGDKFSAWEAGNQLGAALATIAMRRIVRGSKGFDMGGLISYVLEIDSFKESHYNHARLAIFISICSVLQHLAKHALEDGAVGFAFDSETDAMDGSMKRAATRVKQYQQCKTRMFAL